MKIVIPKESRENETRVSVLPSFVAKLVKLGATVEVESGLGKVLDITDSEYSTNGASVSSNREDMLKSGDMILRIHRPEVSEVALYKKGSIHVSLLDINAETDLMAAFKKGGVTVVSLEYIPRTTLAQKMDILSSQANLAGYEAVMLGTAYMKKVLPMMTTPAGGISPSRVFIIGVGVAGLQAIATAKRLGARVEAFDTRPVVEDQVKSLGAKFVKIDLGEMGQTKDGYAKELTADQIKQQKEAMTKVCSQADLVLTTAQVFGRKAPILVDAGMIQRMKTGAVIVDCAIETGGNVEGASLNDVVVTSNGVKIVGMGNLAGRVAENASQMFSANLYNLIEHFWDKEKNVWPKHYEDEILEGCVKNRG